MGEFAGGGNGHIFAADFGVFCRIAFLHHNLGRAIQVSHQHRGLDLYLLDAFLVVLVNFFLGSIAHRAGGIHMGAVCLHITGDFHIAIGLNICILRQGSLGRIRLGGHCHTGSGVKEGLGLLKEGGFLFGGTHGEYLLEYPVDDGVLDIADILAAVGKKALFYILSTLSGSADGIGGVDLVGLDGVLGRQIDLTTGMDGRIHLEVGRGVIVHYRHSRPGHGIGRGLCACRKGDFFRGLCRSIKTLSNILYICRIFQIDFAGILPYQHTDAQRQRNIVGLAQGFLGTDGGRSRGIGSDFSAALVGLQGAFHIHHGLVVQLGHRHRGALGSLTQLQVTVIDNIQNPSYDAIGAGGHARRKGAVGSNGQSFPVRRICASSLDDRILADIGLGLYMVDGQHRIHINEAQYIGACP